ncbi:unnamed protein product [Ophioblennius macclurei]
MAVVKVALLLWLGAWLSVSEASPGPKRLYYELGGSLQVTPVPVEGRLTSASWKLGADLVADWTEGSEPEFIGTLKDKASMNLTTGQLTIKKMVAANQGVYTVELNNYVRPDTYDVVLVTRVKQPQVHVRTLTCSEKYQVCNVSCVADVQGAGPVDYQWKLGPQDWVEGEKDREIPQNEDSRSGISCRVKNPISQADSVVVPNIFQHTDVDKPDNVVAIVVSVVIVLVLVVVLVLVLWKNKERVFGWLDFSGQGSQAHANGTTTSHPEATSPTDPAGEEMVAKNS